MKVKLEYFKWLNNKPTLTEFDGTLKELKEVLYFLVQKYEGRKSKNV